MFKSRSVGITRLLRRFRREDGSLTMEAVLWIPMFLAFLAFIADVASVIHYQAQAFRIVQDVDRGGTAGLYQADVNTPKADKDAEVEAIIEAEITARLKDIAKTATVSTDYDFVTADGKTAIRTTVELPVSEIMIVGLISWVRDFEVSFAHTHLREL